VGHLDAEKMQQFSYWRGVRVHGAAVQCDNPITLTYNQSWCCKPV